MRYDHFLRKRRQKGLLYFSLPGYIPTSFKRNDEQNVNTNKANKPPIKGRHGQMFDSKNEVIDKLRLACATN